MNRYSDHLFRELFPEHFQDEPDPKDKLDLERWGPTPEDQQQIMDYLLEAYWVNRKECGEEEAAPYLELFHKIKKKGISACREEVQDEFLTAFWAVDREVEKYYKDFPDMLAMMKLTILK